MEEEERGPAPIRRRKEFVMLIKFLSGPKKNQTAHASRSLETKLLIDAGLVEEVPNTQPNQPNSHDTCIPFYPEPVWAFVRITMTGRPAIRKTHGHSETLTLANWDEQDPRYVTDAAKKADCPADIIERYGGEMKSWLNRDAANAEARQKAEDGRRGTVRFI